MILDTTPPESSCSVNMGCTSAATVSIQYSASDELSGVALVRLFVSTNGSAWVDTGLQSNEAAGEFVFDFGGLDGTYRFLTVATDGAGNVEPILDARACTVLHDTVLPTSTCAMPEVSNAPSLAIDFVVWDALAGASGVTLYVSFSPDTGATSPVEQD